ncbi:hypothetical protein [Fusibacter ferrireducens]|uniref:DUF8052 domain-containing protein n=1 Tax=Fusibacter ferrireducens TaxID=2785058 RepID=A0ABR9ZXX0_9FIRM|nr:hypothetical protein [Fusibacter ferrireducens]MBF4694998.1 hypothetical protein [Fusibacter ferrireducens]
METMAKSIGFGPFLRESLSAYYDILSPQKSTCDFIAKYNERNCAYALKRDMVYYAFENNEVIFYEKVNTLTVEKIETIKAMFQNKYADFVEASSDHMATSMYYVIEVDLPQQSEIISAIKRFRFYRSIKWGLQGWVNGSIILMDTTAQKGYSNPFGKKELKRLLKLHGKFIDKIVSQTTSI